MPDTMREDFPDQKCSDCGEKGCTFKHWGPLVPAGAVGFFCAFCMGVRAKSKDPPKPLGVKPPGIPKEFLDRDIEVITGNESVYELGLTKEGGNERTVSCGIRNFSFVRARIMFLAKGKGLIFKLREAGNNDLISTSLVTEINVMED